MQIGSSHALLALSVALGALAGVKSAAAQEVPACSSLPGRKIYGVGGSAQTPLFGQIASRLRDPANPDDQLTIIYADPGACNAMKAFNPDEPDPLLKGSANYWNAGSLTRQTCQLPLEGVQADFGSMQQFAEFCPGIDRLFEGLGDFEGPIGTVNFFVHPSSSQTSISAEALYFIYGFGEAGGVEPWVDNEYIISRDETSAVGLYAAASAGGIPPNLMTRYGVNAVRNQVSVQWVSTGGRRPAVGVEGEPGYHPAVNTPNFEAAIGFASGEAVEADRGAVRTLAYQAEGQECAYWPDSSDTAFDKINVRTGRYWIWGTAHFFAPVVEGGDPHDYNDIENEHARRLAGYFTGELAPPADLPMLDIVIDNFNIPKCAMQVSRDEDLGPISSWQPDEPCGCYFEARATGRNSCEECETDDDCPSSDPVCRFGYCEVQ